MGWLRNLAFTVEVRETAKKWRGLSSFNTLDEAKTFASSLDQDGLLVNVRIKCPDGSTVKPKSVHSWEV